jgi:hypothetical protein
MKKTLLSICGAALVCGSGFQVQANTIITNAGPGGINIADSNANFGYDFTVGSTPLMITALGLWDGPEGPIPTGSVGDGFVNSHVIGLWDNSGNLLAKATIQPLTVDTLVGEFRYSSVLIPTNPGPVILSANTTYVLGAAFLADDPDTFRTNLSGNQATFDPAVSPGNARISEGGFSFPAANFGPGSFVGPNAMFTLVSNGNGVPEGGSTLLLMAAAIAPLFLLGRVRWQKA